MGNAFWLALPASWKLQDVQAALNVIVALLSAFSIFVFARVCWQAATAQVAKNRNVPVPSLLSVNTLGEVYDIITLLGVEIFSSVYTRILLQCIVVSLLTILALFSGPIARFSTSKGSKIVTREISGFLANRLSSGISHEGVLWNETETSLDRANFPLDQLLDFLPDPSSKWRYREDEWNSSWTMDCEMTNNTPIDLYVENANCSQDSQLSDEIPALMSVFNIRKFKRSKSHWESIQSTKNNLTKDTLVFLLGWNWADYDKDILTYKSVNISIMALHMTNLTTGDRSTECNFGTGPVGAASYTKAKCALRKTRIMAGDSITGSFPDHDSLQFLPLAYTSMFEGRFDREVTAGNPTTVIGPTELVRFYQVYQATQSTRKRWAVKRPMDVEIPIVRVSIIFVAVCGSFFAMCIFGVARFGVFSLKHHHAIGGTPESKLDWVLQSINSKKAEAEIGLQPLSSRHSIISLQSPELTSPGKDKRRRSDFVSGVYGPHQDQPSSSAPNLLSPQLRSNWVSQQSLGSRMSYGYSPLTDFPEYTDPAQTTDSTPLTQHASQPAQSEPTPPTTYQSPPLPSQPYQPYQPYQSQPYQSQTSPYSPYNPVSDDYNTHNARRGSNNYFG